MRKQREEKDFCDGLEELQSKSSSNKLKIKNFNLEKPSSNQDNVEVDNKQGDNTYEELRDQNRKTQLEDKERSFRPV